MASDNTTTREQVLRDRAVAQLKKQRDFRGHLLVYVLVNSFLVLIWAMTGRHGFFWPVFPIVGWGIGVIMNAWDACGLSLVTVVCTMSSPLTGATPLAVDEVLIARRDRHDAAWLTRRNVLHFGL